MLPKSIDNVEPIKTLKQLEEFVYAIIRAHSDMITTNEALDGISLAFREYDRLREDNEKRKS